MLPKLALAAALLAAPLPSMASGAASAVTAAEPLANEPVATLDLDRYSGTWHEVARLPMYFQRKCVARTTARYTRLAAGAIEVRNECQTRDGRLISVVGEARSREGRAGALEVRFAPRWLAALPMVWADYWVVDLDPDYRWAVVGGPDRKYLWVLARAPSLDQDVMARIKARTARRGYPVEQLLYAPTQR